MLTSRHGYGVSFMQTRWICNSLIQDKASVGIQALTTSGIPAFEGQTYTGTDRVRNVNQMEPHVRTSA
jgi:hypothetical protein